MPAILRQRCLTAGDGIRRKAHFEDRISTKIAEIKEEAGSRFAFNGLSVAVPGR
jgi:hypothetical protein